MEKDEHRSIRAARGGSSSYQFKFKSRITGVPPVEEYGNLIKTGETPVIPDER
tara:strand:- start:336 stop:494 length:159 start_codon:yes stop_codon:yes gene_type:complete